MSKNFCIECGRALSLYTNFCPGCGKKTNQENSPSTAQNICRYCGKHHSPSAVFCIGCGKKISGIELRTQVFEKAEIKTTEKIISTEKITSEDNSISVKSKILIEENTSPTTESTAIPSEVIPLNTVFNSNTNGTAGILTGPQTTNGGKHARRFLRQPVIILLVVLVVFLGGFTAYLNGWLKNPFNKPIPYDPEKSIYAADMGDWQNYPDLKKEQDSIAKRQDKLISDLEKGDIEKAIKYFYPDYQSDRQKQMEDNPEGMTTLAAVLSTAEMTFLGKDNIPKENPLSYSATFLVQYEQSGFYITWIKSDGTWYLYDF